MPRKILAPHKEQDGYAYMRLKVAARTGRLYDNNGKMHERLVCFLRRDTPTGREVLTAYRDFEPDHRVISSRRVEEAVETGDFLKLLNSEGLYASYWPDGEWVVSHPEDGTCASSGTTIREAYYRYKAEAELDAQQPGPFGDETEPADDERFCFNCYYRTCDAEPCQSCLDEYRDSSGDWSRPEWRAKND